MRFYPQIAGATLAVLALAVLAIAYVVVSVALIFHKHANDDACVKAGGKPVHTEYETLCIDQSQLIKGQR